MTDPQIEDVDTTARRAARLAAIVAELARTNRPLAPGMSEAHFRVMIERMAQHQLLYEEFGISRGQSR